MSDSGPSDCPFCRLPPERVLDGNAHALAVADAFPVCRGHTLIVLRRHTASFFDLTVEEVAAAYDLLRRMKERLGSTLGPGGYNVGVNVGEVAGQTIGHVHVHLIPRYPSDVEDPVGGVRNLIPGRGRYGPLS
jgi:diadenosine tetraphosphate (Ap4A) HIT family hydrolase